MKTELIFFLSLSPVHFSHMQSHVLGYFSWTLYTLTLLLWWLLLSQGPTRYLRKSYRQSASFTKSAQSSGLTSETSSASWTCWQRTLRRTKQLYQHLHKIGMYSERQFSDDQEDDFFLFAVAVGFVEHCVQFSRQIMRDMGKTYITEFPPLARVNTGVWYAMSLLT